MDDFVDWCLSQQFRFISVDVFDTLLLRQCSAPTDVFSHAGLLLEQANQLPPGATANDYAPLRVQAELTCRQQHDAGEITLQQILAGLPGSVAQQQKYADAELLAEQQFCVPNSALIAALQRLQQAGIQLVLLSDMYLSAQQIRQHLFQHQPFLLSLPLYVSCDTGAAKHDGRAYPFLQQQLQIDPQSWLHIGDHWHADVVNARAAGLSAAWYSPRLDFAKLQMVEQLPVQSADFYLQRRLRSIPPDWWLTPQDTEAQDQQTAYSLGAAIWGPVLTAFADWQLNQAAQAQCEAMLCMLREGLLFADVLKCRTLLFPEAVRIIPIHVSRKALYWPSLKPAASDWLAQLLLLLREQKGYSVQSLCDDLQLELPAEFLRYQQQLLAETDLISVRQQTLWQHLVSLAKQQEERLKQSVYQQQQAFLRYWQSLQLPAASKIALLDLGHGGTCHRLLSEILQQDFALNLLFYHSDRSLKHHRQIAYSSFLRQHPTLCQHLARAEKAFEPWLVGATGSTLSYSADGSPQCGPAALNSAQTAAFRQGVLAFASHYCNRDLDDGIAAKVLQRFINQPQLEEAALYQRLLQEDNFGAQLRYPVLDAQQIATVREVTVPQAWLNWQLDPLWQSQQLHWPAALLRLADPDLASRLFGEVSNLTAKRSRVLLEQIQRAGWQQYSVCGAGDFFRQFQQQPGYSATAIEFLIDQKAETLGPYRFEQWQVISLPQALRAGAQHFVVTSYAFRQQMAAQIYATADALGITAPLSIMMLGQE